jgi:hypothetical protein
MAVIQVKNAIYRPEHGCIAERHLTQGTRFQIARLSPLLLCTLHKKNWSVVLGLPGYADQESVKMAMVDNFSGLSDSPQKHKAS